MRVERRERKVRKKGEMPKLDFDMDTIEEIKKRKKGFSKRYPKQSKKKRR